MILFYWPKSNLHMAELFSARLEAYGIYEFISAKYTTPRCRCLTDGQNGLWVYGDEEGVMTTTGSRGNAAALVDNISRRLGVEFGDNEGRRYDGSGNLDYDTAAAAVQVSMNARDTKDDPREIINLDKSKVVTVGLLEEEDFLPPNYRPFTDAELEAAIQTIDVDTAEVDWCWGTMLTLMASASDPELQKGAITFGHLRTISGSISLMSLPIFVMPCGQGSRTIFTLPWINPDHPRR